MWLTLFHDLVVNLHDEFPSYIPFKQQQRALAAPHRSMDIAYFDDDFATCLQRVWITLLEKGLEFDKHEIDLRDDSGQYAPHQREPWVWQLNPLGKVGRCWLCCASAEPSFSSHIKLQSILILQSYLVHVQ